LFSKAKKKKLILKLKIKEVFTGKVN
jgi:hypothetical protein